MVQKSEKLERILKESKGQNWAILTHKYPDPDGISSQIAMKQKILPHYEITSDIFAYGEISHTSNRTMVNSLEIELKDQIELDFSKYDNVVIVDATEKSVELPKGITPIITIDHHDVTIKETKNNFVDITEKNRGSTATRMVEYLQELKIPMDKVKDSRLATALFYGIYSDTLNLIYSTQSDDESIKFLRTYYDVDTIKKIVTPKYAEHTLDARSTAWENRYIDGIHLISFVGTLIEKEDLTVVVDDLIEKTQGIELAVVYGLFESNILVSLRTIGDQENCGNLSKKIWGEWGSAGGRIKSAGASIPLGYVISGLPKEQQEELVKERLKEDIMSALKIKEKTVKEKETPTL